jgi:tryptophanyl-tRNA synthetase
MNTKKTMLSGIKPTGKAHIGNYFWSPETMG